VFTGGVRGVCRVRVVNMAVDHVLLGGGGGRISDVGAEGCHVSVWVEAAVRWNCDAVES
jgi:hypothetical protein